MPLKNGASGGKKKEGNLRKDTETVTSKTLNTFLFLSPFLPFGTRNLNDK